MDADHIADRAARHLQGDHGCCGESQNLCGLEFQRAEHNAGDCAGAGYERAEDAQRRNDVEAGAEHDLHHRDAAHKSHGNGQYLFSCRAEDMINVFFAQILTVGQHCADRDQNERRKARIVDQREVIVEALYAEYVLHMDGYRVEQRAKPGVQALRSFLRLTVPKISLGMITSSCSIS